MKKEISIINYIKYFTFITILFIGIMFYRDFGFNIDEKFHRLNGFFWLNVIAKKLNLIFLDVSSNNILKQIDGFTLSDIKHYNTYGIIFDVPAAIIELAFGIKEPLKYYQMRHLLVFLYFFFALIYFYKILINRFKNQNIAILGVILLFITPRIFGDSFQNTKDIIFLTFIIISYFYLLEFIDKKSFTNILLLSFFSAISTSIRLFGIILPFSVLILYFFSKKNCVSFKLISLNFLFFILFLILFWPLLWDDTINNFIYYFKIINDYFGSKVYFLDNYYKANFLPYSYLPIWIIISTPVLHIILFILGFFIIFFRFFKRLLSIKEKQSYSDFWRGNSETKDVIILLNFLVIFLGIIFFNIKLYNSWRLAYFLYFFMCYMSVYYINLFFLTFKKEKIRIFFKIILFILIFFTICRNIIYHPYQSLYFNFLTSDKIKNSVEVDYTGLSGINFLREISNLEKSDNINISVGSWYPLWRMIELLPENNRNRIKIIENNKRNLADYIYSNRISEVDKKLNKKYEIPKNFVKYKELNIDGAIIYEVFKKK